MKEKKSKKSVFITGTLREISDVEKSFRSEVLALLANEIDLATLAYLPNFVSRDDIPRPLFLHKNIIRKIQKDHGIFNVDNIIIHAHTWDYVIKNVDGNLDKINLIKLIPNSDNFLVIGANRFNGYFTVTHYEVKPKNKKTIKNLLHNKGDSLDHTGRAAFPSFVTSSCEATCQLGLSDVSRDT